MSILNCVTTKAGHFGLVGFPTQWPDMVSDGSFAISREALQKQIQRTDRNAPKVPTYIKDAMLAPIGEQNKAGIYGALCPWEANKADCKALEVAPLLTTLDEKKATFMTRFDEVDGSMRVYANAHYAKLLSDLFPNADWYGLAPLKPVMLVEKQYDGKPGACVAFFMPIQSKRPIPGWNEPSYRSEGFDRLTNTEILMYVLGWQGGTIHQLAKAMGVDDHSDILDASPDQMRELVRKAQVVRQASAAA